MSTRSSPSLPSHRLAFGFVIAIAGGVLTSAVLPRVSAFAAEKKKKKGGDEEKEKASSEKAATADKAKDEPLSRKTAATFKVETALDQKTVARTKQADQKRDEAIEELKKLVPKAPASRKAEMIFRLAELYWEKSKYRYGLEMEGYEKAHTEWLDGGQKGPIPAIKDHIRESELIKQNALKLYEKVLGEYPTYERNDEVLFYLGYNEYEAGNKDKAVSNYWTLIKQFPESRLVPDAYLQLGEHFFSANDVNKARKAFERALGTKTEKVYNYALYKLAWCDYNVQEYAVGIQKLKEVIDRSEKATDAKSVQLKAEALGDLARFFSYVDEVQTAFDYFKAKGGEDIAFTYSTKLGNLFHDQGKWTLEIDTFKMLIDRYPMNEKAPYLQTSIVEAYSQLAKKDKVRQEVERLVDLYRPGTPWSDAQKRKGAAGTAALEYAHDLTETKLRDLVTEYHRDAQKRKDVATYELARDIYKKYLDAFSDTESAYQMRFFYAEVLWALKEWGNAASQYDLVARMKVDGKAKGQYTRIAAYNAILTWEKIATEGEKGKLDASMKVVETTKKGKTDAQRTTQLKLKNLEKGEKYVEEAIPEAELKLSQACDLYFEIADPTDEELPAIKFKAAYLYYTHNHFVKAAERYFEIIERWPGDKLSMKSAHLVLDSLNVQEKWDELEKYARAFRGNKKLGAGDEEFKKDVQALIEGAAYKSIQVAEKSARELGDKEEKGRALGKIATRFDAFQKEFPSSNLADKAVFSAVVIYDQADELDHAIEMAKLLRKDYPKSEQAQKNHLLLGNFYERIADFDLAASTYASFYEENPKHEKAPDALYNAGVYLEGLGQSKKALEKFSTYTKEFGSRDDASAVYWRTCLLLDADQDWKKTAECWDGYKQKYPKASQARTFESRYRYALALGKTKNDAGAAKEFKWLVAQYPKLDKKDHEDDGVRLAAAHAAFELLDPEFAAYSKMKVTLNKKTLLAKATTAEDLACVDSGDAKCKRQGKFLGILGYGNGDYGIAGLTRMGQVYRGMADAIRAAPIPQSLTEDQIEIYRAELDNVALGPEEKAIQAFENALAKAYELNIYNAWTLLAQDNLKQLNPNKFPDLQKRDFRGADAFVVAGLHTGGSSAAKGSED